MAESKDIEINQFPIVSSLSNKDYIVVSLDDGSQGRIKTSDLASVVAGMSFNSSFKPGYIEGVDLNDYRTTGGILVSSSCENIPFKRQGALYILQADHNKALAVQLFVSLDISLYIRCQVGNNWSNWKQLI